MKVHYSKDVLIVALLDCHVEHVFCILTYFQSAYSFKNFASIIKFMMSHCFLDSISNGVLLIAEIDFMGQHSLF